MTETITAVESYERKGEWGQKEAGFAVRTTEQEITLTIDDESSCCEQWGYFLSEDDPSKFVGASLQGVAITDTNRSTRTFHKDWSVDSPEDENNIYVDDGDTMFVDIETDRGVLQFVAYNAHNGYYGHEARVSSRQLTHSKCL